MDSQLQTYDSRVVSEEEYVFWNQALNHSSDIIRYNWSCAPPEAKRFADSVPASYNALWVESNWQTGGDPVLFSKKNEQIYLLARWGTNEFPLRTEEQVMTSYRRKVEKEAAKHNIMFQGLFFLFEMFSMGGVFTSLVKNGFGYAAVAFLVVGLCLEFGRRLHKNRGLRQPINVWEQQALQFVKNRATASA